MTVTPTTDIAAVDPHRFLVLGTVTLTPPEIGTLT